MGIGNRSCYTEKKNLSRCRRQNRRERRLRSEGSAARLKGFGRMLEPEQGNIQRKEGCGAALGREDGMEGKVGFAVIGCGMISKFHISAISGIAEAYLAGVYDVSEEHARRTAAQYGVRAYGSSEEIWQDGRVDAVCICTPSGLHGEMACQALAHGRHVLVEKPMALTLEDCDRMLQLAQEHGVKLGVVSQLRFAPAVGQAKRLLDSGALGRLVNADLYMKYFRSQEYYDSGGWRGTWAMDGGGALMNQGIHGIDLLLYLAGPAAEVYGRAATLARRIEVEDTLSAVAVFESGALGVVSAGTSIYPGFPRRIELCGDRGSLILQEDKIVYAAFEEEPRNSHVEEFCQEAQKGRGKDRGVQSIHDCEGPKKGGGEGRKTVGGGHRNPGDIGAEGHLYQVGNLVRAILRDEPLLVDGQEGRKAVEMILRIYESAGRGMPVALRGECSPQVMGQSVSPDTRGAKSRI